ncbi:MAG: DUF4160 domain-containing protein [Candidatus Nanopelagicales bacterium]|nr:DUF4160 domain-containing protein [Candidatus Nanopelagicales bacterium]
MPELCSFYGIRITLYFGDHAPAHFHAQYGDQVANVRIDNGETLCGSLPKRAARLVEQWRTQHAEDLAAAWDRVQRNELPGKIEPLA